jgi:hypothetical protein
VQVHEAGPDARRPEGPTIPSAIGNELMRHQHRINNVFQTIRNLTPAAPADGEPVETTPAPSTPSLDEDVDRSAVAPVQWA